MIDLERELENQMECPSCEGLGGWDAATDCETYDNWRECVECQGTGYVDA